MVPEKLRSDVAAAANTNASRRRKQVTSPGNATHDKKYHQCDCYGHPLGLPNYKLLAQPRTNNYYASTGGCPCIPRVAAHPGSWRHKQGQLRSAAHGHVLSCTLKRPGNTCCVHAGETYGWRPGPHTVLAKNCAGSGLCDTFGNMAFKRPIRVRDRDSDVSSVCQQKLDDLEALILEEHERRRIVEMDIDELKEIKEKGTVDDYKLDFQNEKKREQASAASEEQLNDLLREVRGIVQRPLNHTNIDILRRIVRRQEHITQLRAQKAAEDFPPIIHP
ncbi:hypothetical protein ERJ75_000356000 [Trypanosoma vivax]|uniref:Uncharacterized protein n=1 Tax=Trypanosoma vivax (strain Y486) TaxID=1055687 RepID=G0TZZ1_TRYVY|nr:hypothetical protein TRVL_07869 [Trypanosoma vivax]KAH8617665.1 hypothetical protein ERJ75_000356000 [Trypanosoma vivax]CCC50171.1 conserved hypothetical protein [Trypanosoma vivax Y486]